MFNDSDDNMSDATTIRDDISDENLKKAIIYFFKEKFRKDKKYEKMMHGISFMESTMNQISIV